SSDLPHLLSRAPLMQKSSARRRSTPRQTCRACAVQEFLQIRESATYGRADEYDRSSPPAAAANCRWSARQQLRPTVECCKRYPFWNTSAAERLAPSRLKPRNRELR